MQFTTDTISSTTNWNVCSITGCRFVDSNDQICMCISKTRHHFLPLSHSCGSNKIHRAGFKSKGNWWRTVQYTCRTNFLSNYSTPWSYLLMEFLCLFFSPRIMTKLEKFWRLFRRSHSWCRSSPQRSGDRWRRRMFWPIPSYSGTHSTSTDF